MIKNVKKNAIFFGAALVAILIVSGTTVGTMAQLNESLKAGSSVASGTTCVEPGIYLSGSDQRKTLSDSLCCIDNPNAHLLVQAIIVKMDSKGFVNSYDIKQIVNEYNLEFNLIAGIGSAITTGAYPNPGYAIWVGHPFRVPETPVKCILLFWSAKHSYNPARDVNITIYLGDGAYETHFVDDHSGLSIGFSGTFSRGEEETGKWFTIHGSALLHIV
jgi:hypothetical protein